MYLDHEILILKNLQLLGLLAVALWGDCGLNPTFWQRFQVPTATHIAARTGRKIFGDARNAAHHLGSH
jgi:hypothetical protein